MAEGLDSNRAGATSAEGGAAPAAAHPARLASESPTCLNCGAALTGRFCPECGQPAHVHRTLSALFHDLLHGVLHLEGRIWRTLPLLAWRPGVLTRRYIAGERARFVSPVALFLFSVFLMFAVFNLVGGPIETVDPEESRSARVEIARALALERQQLQRLEQGHEEELRKGHAGHAAAFVPQIATARQAVAALESIPMATAPRPELTTGVAREWRSALAEKIRANPSLAFYKVQNNAYKLSWLLIPASLPFLWLLFPSRRHPLYDHAVFVTHSLSFATLLLVALSLVGALVGRGDWAEIAIAAIMPAHMYRHLRGAYGLSRLGALLRTVLLAAFAAATLVLFVLLLLALIAG